MMRNDRKKLPDMPSLMLLLVGFLFILAAANTSAEVPGEMKLFFLVIGISSTWWGLFENELMVWVPTFAGAGYLIYWGVSSWL